MPKRYLLLFLLIACLFPGPGFTESTELTIQLDGRHLVFDPAPIAINDQPMVPMRAFFEALDSRVVWIDETQHVLGYKDNMFIKLQIGNEIAYKNGKATHLDAAPVITNGTTMVPVRFIAETFELDVEWDPEKGHVQLLRQNTSIKYNLYKNHFLKKIYLDDLGVNLSVPPSWEREEDSTTLIDEAYPEPMRLTLSRFDLTPSMGGLGDLASRIRTDYLRKYGETARATGVTPKILQETPARRLTFTVGRGDERTYKIVYLLTIDNRGYLLEASYGLSVDSSYAIGLFDTIAETFHITRLTLNLDEEHYVEYLPAFADAFRLEEEIHSNIEVHGTLHLTGSIDESRPVEALGALITRGSQEVRFRIPIAEDGTFEGTVHTPFGLGKHNVLLYRFPAHRSPAPIGQAPGSDPFAQVSPESTGDTSFSPEHHYLRFSVVNLQPGVSRYLIPTEHVPSAHPEVMGTAKVATNNLSTEYARAKRIYDYLTEHMVLDEHFHEGTLEAFRQDRANALALHRLYVAMLRSVNVEARVAALLTEPSDADASPPPTYLTQLKINNRWVYSDPVGGLAEDAETFFTVYLAHYSYDRIAFLTD